MLKKLKVAFFNSLKGLQKTMGNLFNTQRAENERKVKESEIMEDRLKEESSLSSVLEDGRAGFFPRKYFLLAGAYLVTIVLLLSFVILRWGSVPSPELPGLEGEMSYSTEVEDNKDEEEDAKKEVGEIRSGLQVTENTVTPKAEDDIEKPGEDVSDHELQESVETVQSADTLLMQAASPLSQWSLHHSYGSYVAEKLPSGGNLHRLLNGAFFRGKPGAAVAALWDGYVLLSGEKDGPYSPYVLIQHDGGMTTFYGNLKEVWVDEGSFISRGENIGVLPSQEGPSPVSEQEAAEKGSQQVSIRTIYRGVDGEVTSAWSSGEWQTDVYWAEPAMAASTSFHGESPLLYLEVRHGNSYIDPLKFIHTRN